MEARFVVVLLALAAAGEGWVWAAPWEAADVKNGSRIEWSQRDGSPGRVLPAEAGGAGPRLELENDEGLERRFNLMVLRQPEVTGKVYALRVPVRYQNVQGMAYLETWNYFRGPGGSAQEQAFFSRTLAAVGPLAALNGTSDGWSERVLFFMADGRRPTRVELNLFLPGKGRVELGTLEWIANAEVPARQVGLVTQQPALKVLVALVVALAALAALVVAAAVIVWRRRRAAERRRMLAADAGRRG